MKDIFCGVDFHRQGVGSVEPMADERMITKSSHIELTFREMPQYE